MNTTVTDIPGPITPSLSLREKMLAKQFDSGIVVDKVEEYLATAPNPEATPLEFWRKCAEFPVLQRVARDYLGIPSTSVLSRV